MKALLTLTLSALLLAAPAAAQTGRPDDVGNVPSGVKVLFSPTDDLEAAVIRLIASANTQILFNQRLATNPRILHALLDAFAVRKVYVAGILDANPPVKNYKTPAYLVGNRIPVFFAKVPGGGENATRYLVIDKEVVATGSYEWTATSQGRNNENLLIVSEPTIAQAFVRHFERALNSATPADPAARQP